jgi:hypothetical protein
MNKFITSLVAVGIGISLSACASSPIKGKYYGGGSIYSAVNFNERTSDAMLGSKRGEGCATNILGIVATGDASAATVAKQAGITKIASVDGTASNILSFYSKYCVVVTGE